MTGAVVKKKWTEKEIIGLLAARHRPPEWAFWAHLRNCTGFSARERTIDAFAMNTYPSKGLLTIAYEIKTTKADFNKELENPNKRKFFVDHSGQFFFVTPCGTVAVDEVPEGCGLLEVTVTGTFRIAKAAKQRELDSIPLSFAAALFRREDDRPGWSDLKIFKMAGRDVALDEYKKKYAKDWKLALQAANYSIRKEVRREIEEGVVDYLKQKLCGIYTALGRDVDVVSLGRISTLYVHFSTAIDDLIERALSDSKSVRSWRSRSESIKREVVSIRRSLDELEKRI